jgi:tetratricopeptide (TPR) repeat protein
VKGSDPAILRSDSAARLGLDYFRRAVALDSNYAAAWTGVARMTLRNSGNGPERKAARRIAEAAIQRALAIDSSLAEGHAVFGALRGMAYDNAGAERHLKRAIALEPTAPRHRERLARLYLATDRPVEALVEAERALAIDPLSPAATAEVARALLFNDRCDEALARLEPIRTLDPPLLRVAPIAALCYARKNQWREAIATIAPSARRAGPEGLGIYGYVLARSGDRDGALAVQERIAKGWRDGALGAYDLAIIPAGLGDRDEAFEWLGRAFEDGSLAAFNNQMGLAEPMFAELHGDPRWRELRQRAGLQNR